MFNKIVKVAGKEVRLNNTDGLSFVELVRRWKRDAAYTRAALEHGSTAVCWLALAYAEVFREKGYFRYARVLEMAGSPVIRPNNYRYC